MSSTSPQHSSRSQALSAHSTRDATQSAAESLRDMVQRGHRNATERVLEGFPQLKSDFENILELLYLEHLYRLEFWHGSSHSDKADTKFESMPDVVAEFSSRFPELRDDLVKLFQVAKVMEDHELASSVQDFETPYLQVENNKAEESNEAYLGEISDYFLLEEVGQGGMGIVYRARQKSLGRIVALKTLSGLRHLEPSHLARFQREAELASSLQHPNIVPIHEVGSIDGFPFFSMEFVEGGSLSDAIRNRTLRPDVAARLMGTIARAVEFAHSKGVIHRDLKPGNILLAPSERPEALTLAIQEAKEGKKRDSFSSTVLENMRVEPKIVDFGLAMQLSKTGPNEGVKTAGTPSYMAPEQIDTAFGKVGPQSDVYSLGSILYHLLVGRPPFCAASTRETLRQVCEDEPLSPRSLQPKTPVDLETICLKCLRKSPSARYASAFDLADDLQRFLDAKPIQARPAAPWERLYKWGLRNQSITALIGVMLVAVALTTWLWRRSETSLVSERLEKERSRHLMYVRDVSLAHLEYNAHNIDRAKELLLGCHPEFRNWEWEYTHKLCDQPVWHAKSITDQPLFTAALSHDGQYVATGHGVFGMNLDQTIYVWNVAENRLQFEFKGHAPCLIGNVVFRSPGDSLLSSGFSWEASTKPGKVLEWDLATGTLRREYPVNAYNSIYDISGQLVIAGEASGNISIFSRETGELLKAFKPHTQMVLGLCCSRDGRFLVSTGRNGTVAVHEIATGKEMCVVSKIGDPRVAAWSPDMSRIHVANYGGDVTVFRWEDNRLKKDSSYARTYGQYTLFAPDGLTYATAVFGEGVDLRDARTGRVLQQFHGHSANLRKVCFDATGHLLLTAGADGSCRIWDLTIPEPHHQMANTDLGSIADAEMHPTKKEFAIATKRQTKKGIASSGKPRIEIWDWSRMKRLQSLLGHTDWLTCLTYSSDGKSIASGSLDCSVRIWDADSGTEVCAYQQHQAPILGTTFLENDCVFSVDSAGVAHVWDVTTSQKMKSWPVYPNGNPHHLENAAPNEAIPIAVAATANAKRRLLAVVTQESLSFWNIDSSTLIASKPLASPIYALKFSSDGKQLGVSTVKNELEVWQVDQILSQASNTPHSKLRGHNKPITSFTFSPDGKRIVTSSQDQTVRLFDSSIGHELLKIDDARGEDNHVSFSRDGRQILRAEGRNLWLYSLDPVGEAATMHSEEALTRWHDEQLKKARGNVNLFAAKFHANALMEREPDSFTRRLELAYILAHAQRHVPMEPHGNENGIAHKEAHDSSEEPPIQKAQRILSEPAPTESQEASRLSQLARLALRTGDLAAYRNYCLQLVEVPIKADKDILEISSTLGLNRNSGVDLLPWMKHMIRISTRGDKNYHTLALLYYRAGRITDANRVIERSLRAKTPAEPPLDWIVRAMIRSASLQRLISQWRSESDSAAIDPNVKIDPRPDTYLEMITKSSQYLRAFQPLKEDLDRIAQWYKKLDAEREAGTQTTWLVHHLNQFEIPLLMYELESSLHSLHIDHPVFNAFKTR